MLGFGPRGSLTQGPNTPPPWSGCRALSSVPPPYLRPSLVTIFTLLIVCPFHGPSLVPPWSLLGPSLVPPWSLPPSTARSFSPPPSLRQACSYSDLHQHSGNPRRRFIKISHNTDEEKETGVSRCSNSWTPNNRSMGTRSGMRSILINAFGANSHSSTSFNRDLPT